MTPEAQAALNLDLRHVMFMQNAAEPVRASTVSHETPVTDESRTLFALCLPSTRGQQLGCSQTRTSPHPHSFQSQKPPPRAQMYLARFLYPLPYPECFLPSLKYVPRAKTKTKTKRLCLCPRLRL